MIPRGSLDIAYRDIFSGFYYCCWPGNRVLRLDPNEIISLSVRSGFDLLLTALQLPKGSEILVTDINIPGMFEIIRAHGLTAVPLPLCKRTLTVSDEDLRSAISPLTRAVVFTHLFGAIMELDSLLKIARENGFFVIEDCAQAFDGDYRGNRMSDVAMFSFGMIKTNTALGGALLTFKDRELCKRVQQIQESFPVQSRKHFLKKLLTALLVKILSERRVYSVFWNVLLVLKKDPDKVLSGFTRGFPGRDLLRRIRIQPCRALQLLLRLKLNKFDRAAIVRRQEFGKEIIAGIPVQMQIGSENSTHSFWVLPVESKQPEKLIAELRKHGFDATSKASSLVKLPGQTSSDPYCNNYLSLDKLVYLPVYPRMTGSKKIEMLNVIKANEGD